MPLQFQASFFPDGIPFTKVSTWHSFTGETESIAKLHRDLPLIGDNGMRLPYRLVDTDLTAGSRVLTDKTPLETATVHERMGTRGL